MSSMMFVCLNCRITRRLKATASSLLINHHCQFCHCRMQYVFHKFEVPGKTKDTEWETFTAKVRQYNRRIGDGYLDSCKTDLQKLELKLRLENGKDRKSKERLLQEIEKVRVQMSYWYDYGR